MLSVCMLLGGGRSKVKTGIERVQLQGAPEKQLSRVWPLETALLRREWNLFQGLHPTGPARAPARER